MDFTASSLRLIDTSNIKKPRWSAQNILTLSQCIEQGMSLQEISHKFGRTVSAIFSKGNELGYGYFTDKENGRKYFKPEIKHKSRRTKEELKRWKESAPIPIQLEIYDIWLIVLTKFVSPHFIHIKEATLYTAVGCMESCKRLFACSRLLSSKYVVVHSDCGVTVHKETEC